MLGGLPSQNSRIFPGSYEKAPQFFKESQALKEKPQNSRFSRFSRWFTNPDSTTAKVIEVSILTHNLGSVG